MDTEAGSVFDVLTRYGLPFVVIGGHAVNYHGYIRATEDHDVVLLRNPDSELALLQACQEMNAAWISDEIDPSTGIERLVPVTLDYIQREHLMMLWTDRGYLDVFDYIPGFPGEPLDEIFGTSEKLDGIRFVSLEWLRRMKTKSGRARDLDDLANLSD